LDSNCGTGELEAANSLCAADKDEDGETLDNETLDNNGETSELEAANSLCVVDEDEDGEILEELEGLNAVCVPAEGGATLDNGRGPLDDVVTN
jgi:hypothetical protein